MKKILLSFAVFLTLSSVAFSQVRSVDISQSTGNTWMFRGTTKVGTGTPSQAMTEGSLYINGKLETANAVFLTGLGGNNKLLWINSSGQVQLVTVGTGMSFDTMTGTLTASGTGISGSLTNTRVPYATGASTLADDSTFTWDNSIKSLILTGTTPLGLGGTPDNSGTNPSKLDIISSGANIPGFRIRKTNIALPSLSSATMFTNPSITTDTFFSGGIQNATNGGGVIQALSIASAPSTFNTWILRGIHGGTSLTTGSIIGLQGYKHDGSNNVTSLANGEKLLKLFNAGSEIGTVYGNGDLVTPQIGIGLGTSTQPIHALDVSGSMGWKPSGTKTSAYTAASEIIIPCDPSGGGFTVNLPALASVNTTTARIYVIKNITNSTNTITIDASGSEEIDDVTTKTITTAYGYYILYAGATDWRVISTNVSSSTPTLQQVTTAGATTTDTVTIRKLITGTTTYTDYAIIAETNYSSGAAISGTGYNTAGGSFVQADDGGSAQNKPVVFVTRGGSQSNTATALRIADTNTNSSGPLLEGRSGAGSTVVFDFTRSGDLRNRRIKDSYGSALSSGNWSASGWGASAAITITGTDTRGTVTVTTNAADTPSANPTLTLTFVDGTWTTAPFTVACWDDNSTGPIAQVSTRTISATQMRIQYNGTPTATSALTYKFTYMVKG